MKLILSVLMMVAAGIVGANGDAVSCSVIDYLYYSSDCCDGSNSVQCMESIPQTDKAAIDNLATLKRSDGAACVSGDSIEYYSDGANFTGLVCGGGVTLTHKLDDGAGYADAAAFVAANTLIADSAACLALADDILASIQLITGFESYAYNNAAYIFDVTEGAKNAYPAGCSVRTGGGTANHLSFNPYQESLTKPSTSYIAVVAP